MVAPTARRKARVSALDTVILALELLKRIPRGRRVTAAQLHEQLADQGFQRDLRSILVAAVGAVLLLLVLQAIGGRGRGRSRR